MTGIYENELYPGMKEMLAATEGGRLPSRRCVSKPEPFVKRILEYFGIAEYFDVAVGSGLDGSLGQKEDVVREALRRLGEKEGATDGGPSKEEEIRRSAVMVGRPEI